MTPMDDERGASGEYRVEVDRVTQDAWAPLVDRFADANLYQTWEYGALRGGAMSHLVLSHGDEPVAAAQLRIAKMPVLGGVAYMRNGPLWKKPGAEPDPEHLRHAVRALRVEYVKRRGLVLRVLAYEFDDHPQVADVLTSEGLVHKRSNAHTVMVDLAPSLEDIRKNLVGQWRTDLNRAERGTLEWTVGHDLDLYARFEALYAEMHDRKGFTEFVSVEQFRQLQKDLPDRFKLSIALCTHEGRPVAGAVNSVMGDAATAIFWATSPEGRGLRGAYFLQWRLIEHYKAAGFRWYDTGGLDKARNPGTYRFKMRMAGKEPRTVRHLGEYEAEPRSVGALLVRAGDALRTRYRDLRMRRQARNADGAAAK